MNCLLSFANFKNMDNGFSGVAPRATVAPAISAPRGLSSALMWTIIGISSFITLVIAVYVYFAPVDLGEEITIPRRPQSVGESSATEESLRAMNMEDLDKELEEINNELK